MNRADNGGLLGHGRRGWVLGAALVVLLAGALVLAMQVTRPASSSPGDRAGSEEALRGSEEIDGAFAARRSGSSAEFASGGEAPGPVADGASGDRSLVADPSGRDAGSGGAFGAAENGADEILAEPLPPLGEDEFPPEAAPRVPKPAAVKGLYINAWTAGSSRRMEQLFDLADRTEINTFVIDVKDATGYVSYRTGVARAKQLGADREIRIRDVRALLARLREHGIYPIARIVVFKDPLAAARNPAWSIQKEDGSLWRDHNGELWVDPYNREIWDYHIALAREAVLLGFSEVQWDYVRFPDVPERYMRTAVYPAQGGRSRSQGIREFLQYSREQLADLGVPVTADVFGLTVSVRNDMGIGQHWEDMVDATDVLLPMVYPSHFARGSYGIPVPNADPYQTVKKAMEYAVRRTEGIEGAAAIRPWLQDFTLGWPRYGAAEVRAQIQATYDAGLSEWVLWNPSSRYTAEALAPKDGPAPSLPIPVHTRPVEVKLPEPKVELLGVPAPAAPIAPVPVRPDSAGRR